MITAAEKKRSLKELYERVVALWGNGSECRPEFLCEMLGVTRFGASCLLYMLYSGEYCPELWCIYTHDDIGVISDKNEAAQCLIRFLEDMPPFQKDGIYCDELSKKDKERYIEIGVAYSYSFEEYRLLNIEMYVLFSRILHAWRRMIRDAIKNKDRTLLAEKFTGQDAQGVTTTLRKEKFRKHEIVAALEILA